MITPVALVSVPVKATPMAVPAGISRSLAVADSVSTMMATLDTLTPADRGRFLQPDGTPYPGW